MLSQLRTDRSSPTLMFLEIKQLMTVAVNSLHTTIITVNYVLYLLTFEFWLASKGLPPFEMSLLPLPGEE